MNNNIKVTFGEYKGKTLDELQSLNPQYLLWLAGIKGIYSFKSDPNGDKYCSLMKEYPAVMHAVKEWVKGRCYKCWKKMEDSKHFCEKMRHKSFYEYHPYGKRN